MTQQDSISVTGEHGNGAGEFYFVSHSCWTKEGHLVALESNSHRIQIFDEKLKFVRSFGEFGEKKGQFDQPSTVCTGKGEDTHLLFIADAFNNRVVVMNVQGDFLRSFPCPQPCGVCVDAKNNLFVTCWANYNHDIDEYEDFHIAVMDKDGQPLRQIGSKDKQEPHLDHPGDLCVSDEHGQLFVVDSVNHRVVVLSVEGQLVHSFGTQGQGPRQFNCPQGICLSDGGVLFVSDTHNNRVVCYGWDGVSERLLGPIGKHWFNGPCSVSIDSQRRLAIADCYNHRVVVLKDTKRSRVSFLMCLLK